ncbi:MAG TPA: type II secretion system protein GspL [Fluviicoccus sp.]|nr:type II secretion system protein GspL [Fluviicoccus sp.]
METLFIRIASLGGRWQGWLQKPAGIVPLTESDLESLMAGSADGKQVVLLVPTTAVLMAPLPVSRQQLRQIGEEEVLYMLEDQTLTPVEKLHGVFHPVNDNQIQIAAIDQQQLQSLLEPFKAANCRLTAAIPDIFLVPENPGGWSLAVDALDCWVRFSAHNGMRLEAVNALSLLQAAWQEASPGSLRVYGDLPQEISDWLAARGEEITVEHLPQLEWTEEFSRLGNRHPFNFLQGDHAVKTSSSLSGHWRYAAIFLAVALAVQLAYDGLRLMHFKKQALASKNEAIQLYQSWFPEEQRIVNLRRQAEARLAEKQSRGAGFMPLMTRVGQVLNQGSWQTRRIDFDDNGLLLEVDALSLSELDQLRQQLNGQGVNSETLSANSQGSGIRGRLRISENS